MLLWLRKTVHNNNLNSKPSQISLQETRRPTTRIGEAVCTKKSEGLSSKNLHCNRWSILTRRGKIYDVHKSMQWLWRIAYFMKLFSLIFTTKVFFWSIWANIFFRIWLNVNIVVLALLILLLFHFWWRENECLNQFAEGRGSGFLRLRTILSCSIT